MPEAYRPPVQAALAGPDPGQTAEIQALRAQLNQEQAARQEQARLAEEARRDLEALKAARPPEEAIDYGTLGLEQLDAAEARKVAEPILRQIRQEQDRRQQELERKIQANEEGLRRMAGQATESARKAAQERLDGEILAACPDFFELNKDPRFVQFKATPVTPNSSTSYGDLLSAAYFTDMNPKGFADIVGQYRAWVQPRDVGDVAQAASAPGTGPAVVRTADGPPNMEARLDLLRQRRDGELTRARFRELLNPKIAAGAPT
jgi:hypothetical protein